MPRTLTLIVHPGISQQVIAKAKSLKGAGSVQLQKDGAISPPGDVITISATNGAAIELNQWLKEHKIGKDKGSSISISEPTTLSSNDLSPYLKLERNMGSIDEIQAFLHKPTATDLNTYMIMFGAGIFATTGIITNAVHLALAGFIFAPGFQPVMMIAFGLTNRSGEWKRGLKQTFLMFLALLAGAILAGYTMEWFGNSLTAGKAAYLPTGGILIDYWASLNKTAYFIAATAGFTGAFAISSRQPSLIPAITIAVALIPSMSIVGIGIVAGEIDLITTALSRWGIEILLILIFSSLSLILQSQLNKSYIKI